MENFKRIYLRNGWDRIFPGVKALGGKSSGRFTITARFLLLALVIMAALFAVNGVAEAGQWGTAKNVTIVANSTGNTGHKGLLTTDGTSDTQVLTAEINSQTLLTSAELDALSSLDGATSYVSSAGSAGNDEYVRLNMTLNGVLSVNYVVVKVQMRTVDGARDQLRFGAFNYSTGRWIRLNGTTATLTFTNLTYNISSTAEKNAYLNLSSSVLNLSLLAWGFGGSSDTVDVSYFEATVSYNQVAELSGYVTDNSTGLAISGATVTTNTSLINVTDANGFYKFSAGNGTYIINASKSGYVTNSTTVAINGADSLNNNISLFPFTGGARLFVFTDKKTYSGWKYSTPKGGTTLTAVGDLAADLRIIVYAVVLDEDGNIMTGRANALSGFANETQKLSPGGAAGHHNVTPYPNIFGNFSLTFVDDGSIPEDTANDGIYVAIANLDDTKDNTLVAEHIKYNISVTDSVVGTQYTEVLISGITCMQSFPTDHLGVTQHVQQTGADDCAVCHHGYEHWYENKSGTFNDSQLDIHTFKTSGIDVTASTAQQAIYNAYRWNYSDSGGSSSGPDNWEAQVNGSKYCAMCHMNFTNPPTNSIVDKIFDYGSGTRNDATDVPSCNNSACHKSGKTLYENTVVPPWSPSAMGPVQEGSNENITKAKSHNHTTTSPARVACILCHDTTHSYNLPNMTKNTTATPINEQCWLCHNITGGLNITSNGGTNVDHSSTDCKSCHKDSNGSLDVHRVPIAGGPDCISCHDYGKTASYRINNSAMNSSNAVHASLNKNATNSTNVSSENKKCWGCHTSNGSQPANTSMGDRYDNPYKCYDCHNSTSKPYVNVSSAMNVSEHFKGGAEIMAASSASDNSSSCAVCHNLSELKVPYTEDDIYNSNYSLSSHYATNRTDLRSWNSGSAVNCSYCHQNTSTAFSTAMLDPSYNSSIQNHTQGASPACYNSTCHGSGWLHNSTLRKPQVNSTLCTSCHTTRAKHNNTVDCSGCHLQTNRSIHPVQYLQQDGSTFKVYGSVNKTSAINCTNCHQTSLNNFSSAPQIPNPLRHSNNFSNGSIWNGTPYWTSGNGSCYYCHNDTKHNATALGRVSTLLNDPNNTRKGSLTNTTYCADCHYNDSANAYYNGSKWDPVPPLITVNNTGKSNWVNHSTYFSSGYRDEKCRICHAINGSYPATSQNYSHSLDEGKEAPNCILCHNLVTGLQYGAPVGINFTAANVSSHNGTNSNNATIQGYAPIIGACWACHDSDGNVTSGHPDKYKTPKTCVDCHLSNGTYYDQSVSWGLNVTVSEHYYSGDQIRAGNSSSNISSCINCHENVSEMIVYNNVTDNYGSFPGDGVGLNGGNNSFYHYGKKRDDLSGLQNTSGYCAYCHQNITSAFPVLNRSMNNHTTTPSSPACTDPNCHNGGRIHDSTLDKTMNCVICHASIVSQIVLGYNGNSAPTGQNMTLKRDTQVAWQGWDPPATPSLGLYARHSNPNSTGGYPGATLAARDPNQICLNCHSNIVKANGDWRIQNWLSSSTGGCKTCHYLWNTIPSGDGVNLTSVPDAHNVSKTRCTDCHAMLAPTTISHTGEIISPPKTYTRAPLIGLDLNASKHYRMILNTTTGYPTEEKGCIVCHTNATYIINYSVDPINITITDYNGSHQWNSKPYCTGCHPLSGGGEGPTPTNHTSYNVTENDNSRCYDCHSPANRHGHSIQGGAGPNCMQCHNLVTGLSGGAPSGINFTASNASVHNGTNSNNATMQGYAPIIGACWACHDSDGNVTSGHPDKYKTPKTCVDCHLANGTYYNQSVGWGGLTVSEHYYSGDQIRAGNSSSDISSCINCHENVSEMIQYNNDTDYGTSFTGDGIRLVGGNMSFYHYGANRSDLRTWNSSRSVNCSYCHQNSSTAFAVAMLNSSYSSINNHSTASSPTCFNSTCHDSGWIHNSTLKRPALNATNTSTFCRNCHTDREKHNNTLDCSSCHINQSSNDTIHPIKYLLQNATYNTSNSTAVTCITCHQTTAVDSKVSRTPPRIPSPLYHSDNASNGTIWNSYWASNNSLTSCLYCHNDTKHNATALGRPANWKGNNTVNSSLNASTWCSSCHYQGYSNYSSMTSTFLSSNLPVPPEITNGTYASGIYNRSNYYNHSLTGYNDSTCRLCHGINLSSGVMITSFLHNVTMVNTCTDCHYSFEAMNNTTRPDRYVDAGMYNTSLHRSLNCTQCHTRGHRNIGARKACEDCHAVQQNPIIDRDRHNITATPGASVVNNTDCTSCHSSALYNRSIATYGYWKPKDCDYCHTYPDKYYE